MLILHLSDIHFRKSEISTAQDPNFHLRNELVRDVEQQCELLGAPDAIVISGDIAFAGEPEEFAFATEWLTNLCAVCGCSMSSVFVVPGNHDVVRQLADRNLVQMIHREIKAADNPGAEIAKQLKDPDARRLLYESLDNYNQFALQFFCDLLPPERTRATRDLMLNDGSILRLWGLNSSFVSSSKDRERTLFVDPASMQITRQNGVVNLVLAHHHLSWLGQARELEDHLNDVAPVQLFGHVHTNRVDMVRDYVRFSASAATPDRYESDWEPGYNLIELSVDGGPNERRLQVRAHIRVWQRAPSGFRAKMDKTSPVFEHSIKLDNWAPPIAPATRSNDSLDAIDATTRSIEEGHVIGTLRDLALRFYRLSFSKKSEIAGRLELLEDEDMRSPDYERFRRVFIRAHERGKIGALADAVTTAEQR
ncbi:metallophosphoesterase [Aeromonas hydrophila]|uniref:metallophosphoesterase n=1 Tax=Aeromonas hydrophila TaxID=644 RepID=UPI00214D34D9|nr:metallophosphoesterase [Aeromonas hydrophila]MCR3910629.1 metallophosphoesterase [Aeromonas hydrophila]